MIIQTTYANAKEMEASFRSVAAKHAKAGRAERADRLDRIADLWADRAYDAWLVEADAQARRDWL